MFGNVRLPQEYPMGVADKNGLLAWLRASISNLDSNLSDTYVNDLTHLPLE